MARKPSSARWKQRQVRDPFVRRAQAEGWRSRAVFKLLELNRRDHLLRRGGVVVDLGAAPGSWSQLAADKVGPTGLVLAVDLLDIEPLPGVHCIKGDFSDESTALRIEQTLSGRRADLVMSDMSPNISGNWSVDQPRSMHLAQLALELALRVLAPGGGVVIKAFQGEGFEELTQAARAHFQTARVRKPAASRSESREMYLVAGNYRL